MRTQGEGLSLSDSIAVDESTQPTTSSTTDTPKGKLQKIQSLKGKPLVLGETWYLVSSQWYRGWVSACGGAPMKGAPEDESQVKAVDNSSLAGSKPGKLKIDIEEGIDYELLPEDAWKLLVEWYGSPSHTFGRKVIAQGVAQTTSVELHPINFLLYFCRSYNPPKPQAHELSKTATLKTLDETLIRPILRETRFDTHPFRVWRVDLTSADEDGGPGENEGYTPDQVTKHNPSPLFSSSYSPFDPRTTTLEEAMVGHGDRLIIECRFGGGWSVSAPWPTAGRSGAVSPEPRSAQGPPGISREASTQAPLFGPSAPDFFSSLEASQSKSSEASRITPGFTRNEQKRPNGNTFSGTGMSMVRSKAYAPKVRGTTGLNNLGNTCFMNSALQCLAHLPELTEYFLNGVYVKELNPDNPLSTKGDLARSYGNLLGNLFDDTDSAPFSVAPRDFKVKISRHAPSFSGYAQHDTQELLAFLLDGLHEDLNRILKKPYVENPDWPDQGGGDKEMLELAKTFWDGYKKRNDSVIVDLFQGQYRSTLVCPECHKVSITFDPFMYLTLPLPVNKMWDHEIYVVTWDMDRPNYRTRVSMNRNSTVKDLKLLLAKWFKLDSEKILATEIFQYKFYKFFSDYLPVSEILDADTIFFYELPVATEQSVSNRKPSPDDPFVLPVHTVAEHNFYSAYSRTRYTNTKHLEAFGFPFFIAIPKEEAKDTEKIYARIVERYEQTTNLAKDLYRWFPAGKDEDEDAVMVAAPQSETSESSGEMIEAKDAEGEPKAEEAAKADEEAKADEAAKPEEAVKSEEAAKPDEPVKPAADTDDDDMEEVQLPDYKDAVDGPSTPTSDEDPVRGPPKPELFNWWIQGDNWEAPPAGATGSQWDTGYLVNDSTRDVEEDVKTKDGTIHYDGFIRPRDAIVCEWESNLKTYFFGDNGIGPESRWNATEDYVDPDQAAQTKARLARSKSGVTLEDCLNEFVKEEQLGEQDPWYCPRCKKHQQATKKFDIWKVPDILVVHLKRFSNSRMLRDKIDVLVDFPIEGLDLEGRVEEKVVASRLAEQGLEVASLGVDNNEEPMLYDLFAVDEHMGGLGGGHYRAYAKNAEDNKWYHFDDSRVDVTTPDASVTSYAYLLFYRRRTSKPIGGPTVAKIEEAKKFPPSAAPEPQPVEVPLVSTSRAVVLRPATPNTSLQPLGPLSDDTPVTSPRSSPPSLDEDRPFVGPEPWIGGGTTFRRQYGEDLDGTPSSFASQNDNFNSFNWGDSDDRQADSGTGLPSPNVSDDGVDPIGARLGGNLIQVDEDYDVQDPAVDEITVDDPEPLA